MLQTRVFTYIILMLIIERSNFGPGKCLKEFTCLSRVEMHSSCTLGPLSYAEVGFLIPMTVVAILVTSVHYHFTLASGTNI